MAFNLRARVVRSLLDAQQNFDQIAGLLGTGVLKLLAGADLRLAFGTSSLTFSAAAASAQVTVPHGLGVTPVLVGVFARGPVNVTVTFREVSKDATNIVFDGRESANVAVSNTQNCYWLALG